MVEKKMHKNMLNFYIFDGSLKNKHFAFPTKQQTMGLQWMLFWPGMGSPLLLASFGISYDTWLIISWVFSGWSLCLWEINITMVIIFIICISNFSQSFHLSLHFTGNLERVGRSRKGEHHFLQAQKRKPLFWLRGLVLSGYATQHSASPASSNHFQQLFTS